MLLYRFEATFHSTDEIGRVYFCERRFEADSLSGAIAEAEKQSASPPGMRRVRARLHGLYGEIAWSLRSSAG